MKRSGTPIRSKNVRSSGSRSGRVIPRQSKPFMSGRIASCRFLRSARKASDRPFAAVTAASG